MYEFMHSPRKVECKSMVEFSPNRLAYRLYLLEKIIGGASCFEFPCTVTGAIVLLHPIVVTDII